LEKTVYLSFQRWYFLRWGSRSKKIKPKF